MPPQLKLSAHCVGFVEHMLVKKLNGGSILIDQKSKIGLPLILLFS